MVKSRRQTTHRPRTLDKFDEAHFENRYILDRSEKLTDRAQHQYPKLTRLEVLNRAQKLLPETFQHVSPVSGVRHLYHVRDICRRFEELGLRYTCFHLAADLDHIQSRRVFLVGHKERSRPTSKECAGLV